MPHRADETEEDVKDDRAGIMVRMPLEMKEWLMLTAFRNRRSQNAEIVHRLEKAMHADQSGRSEGGVTAAGQASQA